MSNTDKKKLLKLAADLVAKNEGLLKKIKTRNKIRRQFLGNQ